MELLDFKVLLAVAQSGSFSRAAAELSLTQPSVSARIAALEHKLDTKLFTRSSQGASLTESGKRLLPYAERCLELINEAHEVVHYAAAVPRVVMGFTATLADLFIRPLILALEGKSLEINFLVGYSWELRQKLLDGVIDVVVGQTGGTQSGIQADFLFYDPIVCVTAAKHSLVQSKTLHFADIATAKLLPLGWEAGPSADQLLEHLSPYRQVGIAWHTVKSTRILRQLVLEDDFISLLPYSVIKNDVKEGRIVQLELEDLPKWELKIAVSYRNRKRYSEHFQLLLKTIKQVSKNLAS